MVALSRLLPALFPAIESLHEALNRGRFSIAAADRAGRHTDRHANVSTMATSPRNVDAASGRRSRSRLRRLCRHVDQPAAFRQLAGAQHIADWPRTSTGSPKLDKDTLKELEGIHPDIVRLKELQKTLAGMRNNQIETAIGADGRNRVSLHAFGASSSRNTPKAGHFIFGQAKWYRCLIKPEPGFSIAIFDYGNQEFAIAAVFSGDEGMLEAYLSGDPYMTMAIQAGMAPPGATKETHPAIRKTFKTCALGIQYGSGPNRLSRQLGIPLRQARELHRMHRTLYPKFWSWSERRLPNYHDELHTVFGWKIRPLPGENRTIRNFPMQGNGGEILREATCRLVDAGVDVCALVHDAIVIISPTERLEEDIDKTVQAMQGASKAVLGGFAVDVESNVASYPQSYVDKDGAEMWNRLCRLMCEVKSAAA